MCFGPAAQRVGMNGPKGQFNLASLCICASVPSLSLSPPVFFVFLHEKALFCSQPCCKIMNSDERPEVREVI